MVKEVIFFLMIIEKVPSGPFATNAYLVGCEESGVGMIIDPSPKSASKLMMHASAHGLEVVGIYLTHSHWDHFWDAAKLKREYGFPIWVHRLDAANLEKPGSDGIPILGSIEAVKAEGFLENGQKIKVGTLEFEVIFTPGHSPGGVSFYFEKEKVLFSGDTLFKGTCGNTSFPTSSEADLWDSLLRLMKLPEDVRVFPGHGEDTTIAAEKEWVCR